VQAVVEPQVVHMELLVLLVMLTLVAVAVLAALKVLHHHTLHLGQVEQVDLA
jgi:hypothetical protein